MAKAISRRNMLSLAATTLGGIAAWAGGAQAKTERALRHYQPAEGSTAASQGDRPYWEESYTDRPVLGSALLRCVGHCHRVSSLPQESMHHEKIVEQDVQRKLRTHTCQSMT